MQLGSMVPVNWPGLAGSGRDWLGMGHCGPLRKLACAADRLLEKSYAWRHTLGEAYLDQTLRSWRMVNVGGTEN